VSQFLPLKTAVNHNMLAPTNRMWLTSWGLSRIYGETVVRAMHI